MFIDPSMGVYRSKSEYINLLKLEDNPNFRESLALAALLSESAFQLLLTFTQNAKLASPVILRQSVDIQWRAVEKLTDVKSLGSFLFDDLYTAITEEGNELLEFNGEVFPDIETTESPIGCILELHLFLLKPEKIRLTKAIGAFLHQATMLAFYRLTALGVDVSDIITPEKEAKIYNAQEMALYIDLLNWIFEEAINLSASQKSIKQSRTECQRKSIVVITEVERLIELL